MKSNKPLKAKTNLTTKTSLKARTAPVSVVKEKKRKPPVKLANKTAAALTKPTDDWFSWYVRLRDCERVGNEWHGQCITCPRTGVIAYLDPETAQKRPTKAVRYKTGWELGHFKSRGFHSIRYDEENCNLQCSHCNAWEDKDNMIRAYREAVDLKYGNGTAKKLDKLSKLPDAHKRLPKADLLQIIHDSKEYITYVADHP